MTKRKCFIIKTASENRSISEEKKSKNGNHDRDPSRFSDDTTLNVTSNDLNFDSREALQIPAQIPAHFHCR